MSLTIGTPVRDDLRIASSALNVTLLDEQRRRLVDQVSVNLERGSVTALLGAPGSGATDLLDCLAGRVTVSSGHVLQTAPVEFLRCDLEDDYLIARMSLAQRGHVETVVVATQDPAMARLADRVLVFSQGRIVDDIG